MTPRRILFALGSLAALCLVGCDAYDPNLGERPFRCGEGEPRCPDGYTCVEHDESTRLCERAADGDLPDGGPDQPDAVAFSCNDDSEIEPNDTINQPTLTPIPDGQETFSLARLAICPTDDVDVFRFRIAQSGKNVQVDVTFNPVYGNLIVDVLNSGGVSIGSATPVAGDPNRLRASLSNQSIGVHYVQVKADPGVQNNYAIDIVTSGP